MDWNRLADDVLGGLQVDRDQALIILASPDDELLALLHAGFRLRRAHHGRRVRVHVLKNARRGGCSEDCSFCSQSARFQTGVDREPGSPVDELVAGAREAAAAGAVTYCMVTATRGPREAELEQICAAAARIKAELPLRLCASLGLLDAASAQRLKAAGVDRYNHNLETSARFYPQVCSTHTWSERHATLAHARDAGMEACAGGIMGMGETAEDRVDLALALRALGAESVPVNLLDPREGTPLGDRPRMSPTEALRVLAMFRFMLPDRDIRVAGGREAVLGSMQPLALYVANSLFSSGYLTTPGQSPSADAQMLAQAGFEAELPTAEPPAVEA